MSEPIHNVVNNGEYDDFAIEEDTRRYLKKFLTKQMCKILIILFSQTLSNKELAEKMGISASALSNILIRMKTSKVKLFNIQREDKYIFYSLTVVAQAYVKSDLITVEDQDIKIIQFKDDETLSFLECSGAVNKLKNNLQLNSEKEFFRFMIVNYVNEDREKKNDLSNFINYFIKLDNEKHKEVSCKIIEKFGDPPLEKNLLHCVSLYKAMLNLCNMSWELSYKCVMSLFESQGAGLSMAFIKECKCFEGSEIAEMGEHLWEIVKISEMSRLSMEEFIACWSTFFENKQFLYFVASRYDSWRMKCEILAIQDMRISGWEKKSVPKENDQFIL